MGRVAAGNAFESRGTWYARTPIAPGKRHCSPMPWCTERERAVERAAIVAELARALRALPDTADVLPRILDRAAAAPTKEELATTRELVQRMGAGRYAAGSTLTTFADVANAWTSGELARRFPDHVKEKKSFDTDMWRLRSILPMVGPIPIAAFKLQDAERAMAALSPKLSRASRRQMAQIMSRVLSLSVYPLRLRESSPFPRGFLPKLGPRVALSWIYPDEEAKVLGCKKILLAWRILEGFLAREGLRRNEATKLRWTDLDLEKGTIRLDASKTDIPRAWALGADVVRALKWWRSKHPRAKNVFCDDDGRPFYVGHAAEEYRNHLRRAGVDRAELFERSAQRRPIRVHDLRASFVTLALATGKTETWVRDRTGHTTSAMLERYRRQARHAEELNFGWFRPMDLAIPEIAAEQDPRPQEQDPPDAKRRNPTSRSQESCGLQPIEIIGQNSGSSGVTPVEVQVLCFAPRTSSRLSAGRFLPQRTRYLAPSRWSVTLMGSTPVACDRRASSEMWPSPRRT